MADNEKIRILMFKHLFRMRFFIVVSSILVCSAFIAGPAGKGDKVIEATEMEEGAGARVKRLFPGKDIKHLDPFVMMDEFFVEAPAGFPDHEHRGFEAITYMLEGGFRHKDNLGNDTIVMEGGAQRFTAGNGLVHSEMPGTSGMNHGIQLWINLPASLKKQSPTYQQVNPIEMPVEKRGGINIRKIAGPDAPVKLNTEVVFQDIQVNKGKSIKLEMPEDFNGYVYVLEGSFLLKENDLQPGKAYLLDNSEKIEIRADKEPVRIIFLAGKPHNEPIRQRGPFVD